MKIKIQILKEINLKNNNNELNHYHKLYLHQLK